MIVAPDGSSATFDRQATLEAYAKIDEVADCACAHCRNFRTAWNLEVLEPSLREACETIGIDPKKSLEMSLIETSPLSGLPTYVGYFPFFGSVTNEVTIGNGFKWWWFTSAINGTARISERSDLVSIRFFAELPWVLDEPGPA
jgi:hypothetical protein